MSQPLIINTWQNAIGDSPAVGFGLVKSVSIDAVPGTVMPGYQPILHSPAAASVVGTFSGGGVFILNVSTPSLEQDGVAVTFATTGTLPSGLSTNTIYYLYKFATGQVIVADSLAHALAHTPTSMSGTGSGTITVSTVNPGTFNSSVDSRGIVYAVDSNGLVWYDNGTAMFLITGNTTTNSNGTGCAAFTVSDASKTYLFVYRNANIDVCDITDPAHTDAPIANSSWTTSWQNMTQGVGYPGPHAALLGQDNIIYACDFRFINSIQEKPGQVFSPSSSTTYTYQTKALTLPNNDTANCLEQLQINLLVGGGGTNLIYPWDRSSPSFALPWVCPEVGVYGLKNIGNTIYILNGLRGIIYKSLGYLVQPVRKLPEYITGNGSASTVAWGAIGVKNGALLFGVNAVNNSSMSGMYLLFPDGRLVLDSQPSLGNLVPTVLSQNGTEFYRYGYAGGFDGFNGTRYSSFGGPQVQSQLYTVGTKTTPATYSQLEVQLDEPGAAGAIIRISYRTSLAASFTVLGTFNGDTVSTSFNIDIGLINIENIQVLVEVVGNANSSNVARVREVRLLP